MSAHIRVMEPTQTFRGTADYQNHRVELDVPLRTLTPGRAPVAALIPGRMYFRPRAGEELTEIRAVDGRLYQQPRTNSGEAATPDNDWADILVGRHFGEGGTSDEAEQLVRDGVAGLILIDGEIWQSIDEPVLAVDHRGYSIDILPGIPAGYRAWQIFALTESAAAMEAAKERSDYSPFTDAPKISILSGEAFTGPTNADRLAGAREHAEKKAIQATALLEDAGADSLRLADNFMLASKMLERAAVRLTAETRVAR